MNLVITHKNVDFDALAAALAAARPYNNAKIVLPKPLQVNVRSFVNLYRDLLPLFDETEIMDEIENLIVVDTNTRERLDKWEYLLEKAKKIVVFDHHPGSLDIQSDESRIEEIGATTTIILEELIAKGVNLTEFEATLLALGIYEDTGCLTYDITTARDAAAIAFLWSLGLNQKMIQEYLRAPLNEAQKELLERLISSSELHNINQRRVLISSTILDEYVAGAAVLIQMLDEIEDAGLTIIIVQMTDNIYMGARTAESDLDLRKLFSPFSVKGHSSSVFTYFHDAGVEEIKEKLVEFLYAFLPPALTAGEAASKPVFTLNIDTTVYEAEELLIKNGFKGCPVVEEGKLVGMISRRDLQKGLRAELGHAPVKGFMSRDIITSGPDQSLEELRHLMVSNNIGRIPIVDQKGNLLSIITRTDILRYLDEFDRRGRFLKNNRKSEPGKKTIQANKEECSDRDSIAILLNRKLPQNNKKLLHQISQLAGRDDISVFLVGGIIRDLLLEYPLEKDLDLVVVGDAISFARILHDLLGGKLRTYEQFGTASLQLSEDLRLDFVTARKEFYSAPASLPVVESSSLKDDLFRRDFTINTIACSLSTDNFGKLYDYFGGQCDLQNKQIRILYKLSFVDDPLRIIRAVRFEQRYGFEIEPETLNPLKKAIESKVIDKVSRPRLNQELKHIYKEPAPSKILKRFAKLGILQVLYPRVKLTPQKSKALKELDKVVSWVEQLEWSSAPDREILYVSIMLMGLESVDSSAIIRKLNLSKNSSAIMLDAGREAHKLVKLLDQNIYKPSELVNLLNPFPVETLMLTFSLSENENVRALLKLYLERLRHMKPVVNGNDLQKLGLKPGPLYGKIIQDLKDAILDGKVRTPQEELNYVIGYLEMEKKKEDK